MSNKIQAALELRKALQIFLATLDADTASADMLEVSSVFPKYKVGKATLPPSNGHLTPQLLCTKPLA